jgi:hypothetical protein
MTALGVAEQGSGARDRVDAACRLCGSAELRLLADLGAAPPRERFLETAEAAEAAYPLHVRVCERCLFAQLPPSIIRRRRSPSTHISRRSPPRGWSTPDASLRTSCVGSVRARLVRRRGDSNDGYLHFQYYTLLTAQRALAGGGLSVVDVELLDTAVVEARLNLRGRHASMAAKLRATPSAAPESRPPGPRTAPSPG